MSDLEEQLLMHVHELDKGLFALQSELAKAVKRQGFNCDKISSLKPTIDLLIKELRLCNLLLDFYDENDSQCQGK